MNDVMKNTDSVKLMKLRRQYRELASTKISAFSTALSEAEYLKWVHDVNKKIAAINRRNK